MWRKRKPSKRRNVDNTCVCPEEDEAELDWDTSQASPTPKPKPKWKMKPKPQRKLDPKWKPKTVPELMMTPEPHWRQGPVWNLKKNPLCMCTKPKLSKRRNDHNTCVCPEEEAELDWDTSQASSTPKPKPKWKMKPKPQRKLDPEWKPKRVPELMMTPEPHWRQGPVWEPKRNPLCRKPKLSKRRNDDNTCVCPEEEDADLDWDTSQASPTPKPKPKWKMKPKPQRKLDPKWEPKRVPELMMTPEPHWRSKRNPLCMCRKPKLSKRRNDDNTCVRVCPKEEEVDLDWDTSQAYPTPKPKLKMKLKPQWKQCPKWKPKRVPELMMKPKPRRSVWKPEPELKYFPGETYDRRATASPVCFPWIDSLGSNRCCYCIPLKMGCYVICFFFFIWAAAELIRADRHVADCFPDRGAAFYYVKLFYLIICVGFVVATCVLLVGVIQEKSILIEWYLYYLVLFCVLFVSLAAARLMCVAMCRGRPCVNIVKFIVVCLWMCLVIYFITVLNSFRYAIILL